MGGTIQENKFNCEESSQEEVVYIDGCKVILRFPHRSNPGILSAVESILFDSASRQSDNQKFAAETKM